MEPAKLVLWCKFHPPDLQPRLKAYNKQTQHTQAQSAVSTMSKPEHLSQLSPAEQQEWQRKIQEANRNNILCHCQDCDYEWVDSRAAPCRCGSSKVEHIACWQFPDG